MSDDRAPELKERRDPRTLLYATLLALVFVGYPVLSSGLGAFDAYARVFSIVYRAFFGLGSIGLILWAMFRLPASAWRGGVVIAFCVLWTMMLARFTWDASFVRIPLPLEWFDLFLIIMGVVLVPAVAMFQAPSQRAFDIARTIIIFGGLLACIFMLVAVVRLVIETNSIDALRRIGTDELNPISLGNVAVTLVIVSLVSQRPARPKWLIARILNSVAFRVFAGLLGGLLVIASASKGPIVALIGVVTVAQIARILRTGSARDVVMGFARLALLILVLAAIALILGIFFNVRVIDRFVNFAADTSTSDRVGMVMRALQQWQSSPWLGSGFVEAEARFYPHNLYVEAMMTMGIPGLCALLAVQFAVLRAGLRLLQTRHDWVAMVCVQSQIALMFSGSMYISAEFWVGVSAVLALDRLLARQAARQPAPVPESAPAVPRLVPG